MKTCMINGEIDRQMSHFMRHQMIGTCCTRISNMRETKEHKNQQCRLIIYPEDYFIRTKQISFPDVTRELGWLSYSNDQYALLLIMKSLIGTRLGLKVRICNSFSLRSSVEHAKLTFKLETIQVTFLNWNSLE